MSFLLWLQRQFSSHNDEDLPDDSIENEENPFEFGQHLRIVIAMLVVVISAFVMWWILE